LILSCSIWWYSHFR